MDTPPFDLRCVRLALERQRVPLNVLLDTAEIVKLAPETKHFTDTITMLADQGLALFTGLNVITKKS